MITSVFGLTTNDVEAVAVVVVAIDEVEGLLFLTGGGVDGAFFCFFFEGEPTNKNQ